MRTFTKITKVAFSVLRMQGHTSVVLYAESLGFTIHPEKSILKRTQRLIYLGFIINSKNITFRLTKEKKTK